MKNPSITKQDSFEQDAMTLRDYFAAKAMQGLISKYGNPRGTEGLLTEDSYNIADAMLLERDKEQ